MDKQYPFDIPLQNILDYVSPYELTRFETQEFLKEDEKEEAERQLKLLYKPRGRPKKSLQTSLNTSPRHIQFATPQTGEKRGRGRPRKFPTTIPSFNGPQPVQTTPTTGTATTPIRLSSEVSSDDSITPRRRQYAMVTASGLLPPEITEDETSREVSVNRAQPSRTEPSAKRQKTTSDSRNESNHRSAPLTPIVRIPQTPRVIASSQGRHTLSKTKIVDPETEDSGSEEVDTVKVQPGVTPVDSIPAGNIDKERETLLKQFLTSDTRAASAETTASSSSSSDSLMSRAIVAQRAQRLSIDPPPPNLATPSSNQRHPTTVNTRPFGRTILPPQNTMEIHVAPTETPPKLTRMRQSMTPHFPHAQSTSRTKSITPKPPPRRLSLSQSNWQPATAIRRPGKPPTQRIDFMSSATKSKQPQDKSSPTSRSSSFKIRPLEPTNDIRKYFRPRYTPIPSQECADSVDEDSESDGPEDGTTTRIAGLLRPRYTAIKQESGSEYEGTDEEEDSDGHVNNNAPQPPSSQPSRILATREHASVNKHAQQTSSIKEEESNSPDPDPIDLIPRSTVPSPPATHTHPTRSPAIPITAMAMDPSISDSDSGSEQEYLSAEEPQLGERTSNVPSYVRNLHTGAELDADTEESSEEEDDDDEGSESANEGLVAGRGLGRGGG